MSKLSVSWVLGCTIFLASICTASEQNHSLASPPKSPFWALKTLQSLSLEEKIGQLLQIRYFADSRATDLVTEKSTEEEIRKYHVGSVAWGVHIDNGHLRKLTP